MCNRGKLAYARSTPETYVIFHSLEFIRSGYYVSNDYLDPELKENNPSPPQWDKLQRNILATNPR